MSKISGTGVMCDDLYTDDYNRCLLRYITQIWGFTMSLALILALAMSLSILVFTGYVIAKCCSRMRDCYQDYRTMRRMNEFRANIVELQPLTVDTAPRTVDVTTLTLHPNTIAMMNSAPNFDPPPAYIA
jgi:hypothetical protein